MLTDSLSSKKNGITYKIQKSLIDNLKFKNIITWVNPGQTNFYSYGNLAMIRLFIFCR